MFIQFTVFSQVPEPFQRVDQVLWVVEDLDKVVSEWSKLGFDQVKRVGKVKAELKEKGKSVSIKMAVANLGGAHVVWIQPLKGQSVFSNFHANYGDGAMSLVHRLTTREALDAELQRLASLGIEVMEEVTIDTKMGSTTFLLMNTEDEGKYMIGYTYGDYGKSFYEGLSSDNLHNLKINQYAFAINDYESVSEFWAKIGQPEFQINHPVLGNTHYYGKTTDHELIQGWQRHGSVDYEWCIPVKPPIVYADHIKSHGEGIHHLAFTVSDMDEILADYTSKDYVNSMGGTWGEKGKPGSGRYEYIDLEKSGGVTMELLWSFEK
jgi:hypothetical protein